MGCRFSTWAPNKNIALSVFYRLNKEDERRKESILCAARLVRNATLLLVRNCVVRSRGFAVGDEVIIVPVRNRWVSTEVGEFQPQCIVAVL